MSFYRFCSSTGTALPVLLLLQCWPPSHSSALSPLFSAHRLTAASAGRRADDNPAQRVVHNAHANHMPNYRCLESPGTQAARSYFWMVRQRLLCSDFGHAHSSQSHVESGCCGNFSHCTARSRDCHPVRTPEFRLRS